MFINRQKELSLRLYILCIELFSRYHLYIGGFKVIYIIGDD